MINNPKEMHGGSWIIPVPPGVVAFWGPGGHAMRSGATMQVALTFER